VSATPNQLIARLTADYIGQLSITGLPYIAYKAPYVVGSIVIASGAVVIALYIMFIMLRPKLKHTWISKIAVALILAVAVCAMHFCGEFLDFPRPRISC
jgi:NO-binding membrane sensor protein with MHYT domain